MSFGLSRGKTLDVGEVGIDMRDLPSAEEGKVDPRVWFQEQNNPLELEIGSGKGTFLLQQSELQPETNFLGFEWAAEFYRYGADRLRRNGRKNVRMMYGDATEFLKHWCKDHVAEVLHLYFSDPWPKKRHHKRRVIQDDTLRTFHRILKLGGALRIVTDHDELWEWCETHIDRHLDLFERKSFDIVSSASEGELTGTNFERKYRREGRPFHSVTLCSV
ncbi:MAG: tRNA (guanosine(46)-N7)-methyltransferase TrmB [Phycisphaerales bacterium]|jgi:tRNA (guanine-N7-)-methyltransferase|nr:tRNA (guanosine(46)-N7)-methyltransferase TrmB [Phycisphaerales bacterium]